MLAGSSSNSKAGALILTRQPARLQLPRRALASAMEPAAAKAAVEATVAGPTIRRYEHGRDYSAVCDICATVCECTRSPSTCRPWCKR